ncbi:MAG: DNA polymerase III subunit alpha [Phycisphaerales bacterium]|nr:DNA polymerase III subunit alpha [Phycisphaerales bacterium]
MATDAGFVHLHVHTHFSLLDGATRIGELIDTAKRMNMPAVAITDHGNLFGAIEFYQTAKKAGIKPLIGCELYLAAEHRRKKEPSQTKEAFHLLVLAQNMTGYRNLLRLSTLAYTEGFYRKPRIDKELLREFNEGLICTSTCLGGEIPQAMVAEDRRKVEELAEFYLSVFGPERFYIELQDHGIDDQRKINPELADLAKRRGVGLIVTNDVHYLEAGDVEAHDILCCINTGALVTDEDRFKFPTGEFYFKSPQQMVELFPRHPEALSNTLRVAELCNLEFDFSKRYAPVYQVPEKNAETPKRRNDERGNTECRMRNGESGNAECRMRNAESSGGEVKRAGVADSDISALDIQHSAFSDPHSTFSSEPADAAYLRKLVYDGALERYGGLSPELRERIDYELSVIVSKGFASYFLIVWDFVHYARSRGIPCGARGSGCSSVVTYCLRISQPDPIRYELYFERFMDPDRDEMPDIDVDICQDGRAELIEYVRRKYGHVAQIITFNTMKAKAALKDVGRVLGLSFDKANALTKLVPADLHITLDKALQQEPELKKLYVSDEQLRKVIDISRKLEGLARNAGVHAAGVVVADQPMVNFLPLYQSPRQDFVITQFDGPTVEKVGLLKMDFLGLRTLSVLERARKLAEESARREIDLDAVDLTDARVYAQFARGETMGIFQFESPGMRDVLKRMRPNRIEDLIAANALYRPGPMAYIDAYVARKHGEAWTTPHPIMTDVLAETYGIMVYQEQVSRLVNRLGNIELKKAFRLAKAISKKKVDQIEAFREPFLAGCAANGLPRTTAEEIFEAILKFGGYAFNKAHSTGYALVAYQTAWMKTYHPAEFMAALLSYEMGDISKVAEYRESAEQMGITLQPPSINRSGRDFTVERGKVGQVSDLPLDQQVSDLLSGAGTVGPLPYGRGWEGRGSAGRGSDGRSPEAPLPHARGSIGRIRFGLGAIKGVGEKAIEAVLSARTRGGAFHDIFDFCERVELTALNRAVIEALICAGAFDETGAMRRAMCEILDDAIASGQRVQEDRKSGQMMMFGAAELTPDPQRAGRRLSAAEWSEAEMLAREKGVLGFYITKHPLAAHEAVINACATARIAELARYGDGVEVVIGGMISTLRTVITKSGRNPGSRMGVLTIEDLSGRIEAILFPDDLTKFRPLLAPDTIVFLVAEVDRRRETPSLRVSNVVPREEAVSTFAHGLVLTLASTQRFDAVESLLRGHRGGKTVYLQVPMQQESADAAGGGANGALRRGIAAAAEQPCAAALLECSRELRVECSDELLTRSVDLLGAEAVAVIGPEPRRARISGKALLTSMQRSQNADADSEAQVA